MLFASARWSAVFSAPVGLFIAVAPLAAEPVSTRYAVTDLTAYGIVTPTAINNRGIVLGDPIHIDYMPPIGEAYQPPPQRSILFDSTSGASFPLPGLGGAYTYGSALNDLGQVVGRASTATGATSFLYSDGRITSLADQIDVAERINNMGTIVGSMRVPGPRLAFTYSHGTTAQVPVPGYYVYARSINDHDQIVGMYRHAHDAEPWHSFIYSNGAATDLGTLNAGVDRAADSVVAYDINDAGQVVGSSGGPSDVVHAFLYSGGVMRDLGTLYGHHTYAFAINNTGQIVGQGGTGNAGNLAHAFVFSDNAMRDLNDLIPRDNGWILQSATDVNDAAQIIGTGTLNGEQHAFLLTPVSVPLPPSLGPALATFAALLSGMYIAPLSRSVRRHSRE